MAVVTGLSAHTTTEAIAASTLIAAAGLTFQGVLSSDRRLRQAAIAACFGCGIAATIVAPGGVGEVAVLIAASRIPYGWNSGPMWGVTVLAASGFAVSISVISHSVAGLLAGIGVPMLVQRTVDHAALATERDRAQALLAEVQAGRDAETRAAALQERGRIARDLHDVLAHSLAGLSVQLQGVRALAAREGVGPVLLDPIDRAAALAQEGLAEARAAVGALRDPGGLGLDAVRALVDRHPGVVTLAEHGQHSAGSVSADAGHAAYRCVQEALTNAARYAPGAEVSVLFDWSDALTITVANSAPDRAAVQGQGSGLGLAGMQERLTDVGGSLTAGPTPDGGWSVIATLPIEGTS
jgi:signal transduction histidine kinase